jgi:hypothetical protein
LFSDYKRLAVDEIIIILNNTHFQMTTCDPTWEVCDAPAEDNMDNTTEGEVVITEEEEASSSSSPFPMVWGVLSLLLTVNGYLTSSSLNSWADDMNTGGTAATLVLVKEGKPATSWYTVASAQLFLSGSAFLLFAINMVIGNNGGPIHMIFMRFSQLATLFPILYLFLIMTARGQLKKCTEIALAEFSPTLGAGNYYSGCSSDTDDATHFADNFPTTWGLVNPILSLAMLVVSVLSLGPISAAYADAQECTDENGEVIECPEEESAAEEGEDAGDEMEVTEEDGAEKEIWWM